MDPHAPEATRQAKSEEAGSEASSTENPRKADLGVLLVHGIGEKKDGEALDDTLNAMVDWLEGWQRQEHRAPRVEECYLRPGVRRFPAHAYVSVDCGGEEPQRLLLVDGWWAEAFHPPAFPTLWWWMMSWGAWVVLRAFARRFVGPVRLLSERRAIIFPLEVIGGLIGAFVLIVPLQLALMVMMLVYLLPIGQLHAALRRVVLGVGAIMGDAQMFTKDHAATAAILTELRDKVDWALSRSQEVLIIAHSQGAALSVELLSSYANSHRVRLVTYGAGVQKLFELRGSSPTTQAVFTGMGLFWIIALVVIQLTPLVRQDLIASWQLLSGAGANEFVGYGWLIIAITLVCITALFVFATRYDRQTKAVVRTMIEHVLDRDVVWADLYAHADPVSDGSLVPLRDLSQRADGWYFGDGRLSGFRCVPVNNLFSVLRDHNSYWKGRDGFLLRVAEVVDEWVGCGWIGGLDRDDRRLIHRRRRLRTLLRSAVSVTFVASAAILYIVRGPDLPLELGPLETPITWRYLEPVASYVVALRVYAVWLIGLSLHVLAGWLSARILEWVWRRADTAMGRKRPPYAIGFALSTLALYVLLAGCALVVVWHAIISGDYSVIWRDPQNLLGLS